LFAALAALPVVTLAALYVAPLATLTARTARWSAVTTTAGLPGIGAIWWFTLWQATLSAVLTIAASLVPAYVLGRFRVRGRQLLLSVLTVAFIMPTVVVAAAFAALLPSSWNGTAWAMIVAHVWLNLAVAVRLQVAGWRLLPTDATAAARTLGASSWHVARGVVWPHLRAPLTTAAGMVFAFSFMSFGVARVLGGPQHPTVEVEIARRATAVGDIDGAAVLAIAQLLLIAMLAMALTRRAVTTTPAGGRGVCERAPGRRHRRLVIVTMAATWFAVLAPMFVLALHSVRGAGGFTWSGWQWWRDDASIAGARLGIDAAGALRVSLVNCVVATAAATAVGVMAALAVRVAITRQRAASGRALRAAWLAPLATSPVAIGFGVLITFDQAPFDWRGSRLMVPFTQALLAAPLVMAVCLPALLAAAPDTYGAAATLGASPTRSWWHIDARRVRGPALAGSGLAAAVSLGDFGAASVLSRTGDPTATVAVVSLLSRSGELAARRGSALATALMVLTAAVVLLVERTPAVRQR
jgi:thiamine transport system permease protein